MTQPDLLTSYVSPLDSHVAHPAEVKRLAAQNAEVLALLRRGPASRDDINAIAKNPTARISDVRKFLKPQGLTVKCIEYNRASGFTRYAIRPLEESNGTV